MHTAAAHIFRPRAAACWLANAALFALLLFMLWCSDPTVKLKIARIYCTPPAAAGAAPHPLSEWSDDRRSYVIARSFHLRSIPAETITKKKSVALRAGAEKSCVLLRAFTNEADLGPFRSTIVFPSVPSFGKNRNAARPPWVPVSDTLYTLDEKTVQIAKTCFAHYIDGANLITILCKTWLKLLYYYLNQICAKYKYYLYTNKVCKTLCKTWIKTKQCYI